MLSVLPLACWYASSAYRPVRFDRLYYCDSVTWWYFAELEMPFDFVAAVYE